MSGDDKVKEPTESPLDNEREDETAQQRQDESEPHNGIRQHMSEAGPSKMQGAKKKKRVVRKKQHKEKEDMKDYTSTEEEQECQGIRKQRMKDRASTPKKKDP